MSFINKFAWSGVAVVFAAVLALGLLAQSATAAIGTAGTASASVSTAGVGGTGAYTAVSTITIAEEANGDIPIAAGGTSTITAPAGWEFNPAAVLAVGGVAGDVTAATAAENATTLTLTYTATGVATLNTLTITGAQIRPTTTATALGATTGVWANGTATIVGLAGDPGVTATATASTATVGDHEIDGLRVLLPGATCDGVGFAAAPAQPVSVPSDGSAAYVLCAHVDMQIDGPADIDDVANNSGDAVGVPVVFTVSQGVVSTGTAKTITAFTTTKGFATTTYRGGCNCTSTDTIIATYSQHNAVATQTVQMAPGTGGSASKIAFLSPVSLAVAPDITNASPGYQSPTTGTNVSVQTTDATGNGVNGEVVLITVDKGGLVAGFAAVGGRPASCPNATKAITLTSATGPLTVGSTDTKAGVLAFTYCGNQTDAPGKATITAQDITTSMATATTSLSMAGRPSKLTAVATGNSVTATVVDAAGNNVADGTPVRFTISSNAGAVSSPCTTTTNGVATSVVALTAATGTVIVSSDWNETGAAATCLTAGAQQTAASVGVPGGTGSSGGTGTPGTGSISSGSVPAAGGFGLIVASGDIKGVVTASGCPSASAAFWATVNGNFVTYVPGTSITAVNADFMAAFPNGILPAATPLIAKCK